MDINALSDSYKIVAPKAQRLKYALLDQLNHVLKSHDVSLGVPIESRVKEWESIADKINRKSLNLDDVTDLDDLVGVRVILLFSKDLDVVSEALRANFIVLHSEDKLLQLGESQFGYQSQHYIVQVKPEWLSVPTWADLGGLRIEIQVRTLAQHIWAAVSHKLQYKQEAGVPPPLRRAINRASALLETVDVEFDRLLAARHEYLDVEAESEDPAELLNVDLVESVLTKIFPIKNKRESEEYSELLDDLKYFGVETVGQLDQIMRRHYDAIMKEEGRRAFKESRDFFFQFVGLAREGLRCEFGSGVVREYLVKKVSEQRKFS